ncbi:MAG: PAS domain S-box protein, partial [Syntrophales bacterium]|nr:PAS domain S-box protein [Syntrophales bacterium]
GYISNEAIGKELHALLAPQKYYQSFVKSLDHFKKTGKGNAVGKTLELSALRKDGTEFPVELSLSAVYLQNRWSAIGIIRDIAERKQFEEKIIYEHKRLQMLLESAPFGIILVTCIPALNVTRSVAQSPSPHKVRFAA